MGSDADVSALVGTTIASADVLGEATKTVLAE